MINKNYLIILWTIVWSFLISWCNVNNQENNQTTSNVEQENLNSSWITLYIDKNCEDAWVQQCQSQTWEQQFWQILQNETLNIEYLNESSSNTIKNIVWVSPALVIPENKIDAFWQQAQGIQQQAVQQDGNYYVALYGWIPGEENMCNDGQDNNNDGSADAQDPTCLSMDVLTSSNCSEQYCNESVLNNMLMWYSLNMIDYATQEWKELYNKLPEWQTLPTFLYNENKDYMENMANMIKDVDINWYTKQLDIPDFQYDPLVEACATDCNASPSCSNVLACNKKEVPEVDLFVMSYCPYGTQALKWMLPVSDLLWDKIDFNVKFVDYIMHDKKEIDENNLQYCIQEEQEDKFHDYMTCFLKEWDSSSCVEEVSIDMEKANTCIENLDEEYNITELYEDKSSWRNWTYPQYNVHTDENAEYGVQGSPTFVLNWVKTQPASRSPQSYLNAICDAFSEEPAECDRQISNQAYDPMWGWTQNWAAAPAWTCE